MAEFVFGIYPGSVVGVGDLWSGKPDRPALIQQALDTLQGQAASFLVRAYFHYKGGGEENNHTPLNPEQYAIRGRTLDLVICHQTAEEPLDGWLDCIRRAIVAYGDVLDHLQIAEEVGVTTEGLDGYYRNSLGAMIAGVIAAKQEIRKRGSPARVGINATPSFGPDSFWRNLAAHAPKAFFDSLDYIGLDFFPGVFSPPQPPDKLEGVVSAVLREFRKDATNAGVTPETSLFITENGWPTGRDRYPEVQATVLATVLNAVVARKEELNIGGYEHFSLRDLASNKPNGSVMHEFGLMDDEYRPKPAFETYRALIEAYQSRETP